MSSSLPLTLVVPVFNEAENFPALLDQVERLVPHPWRMFVVYDFDEDNTIPVVRERQSTRPSLHLLRNNLGRGVVFAIRAGFDAVENGPVLVVMADLSDDLSIVPQMLEKYAAGNRIVCASRYMRGGRQEGGPLLKRWLSRIAGLSLHWLVGFPTHDATNNFRLYDAALIRELGIETEAGFDLALELTAKAFRRGEPIAEVPTHWKDRVAGASRFRLWKWLPAYLRWYRHALGALWRRPTARQRIPAQSSST
jgi:glycosyltransferase involved in cell wall biosynthesis